MTPSSPCTIVGGGSVGVVLQTLLQPKLGSVLIARGDRLNRLRSSPIRLTGARQVELRLDARGWDAWPTLAPDAPVILATKTTGLEPLLRQVRERTGPGNPVVLCHNGLGIWDLARTILPDRPLLRLLCWLGARPTGPDEIHVAGIHRLDLVGLPEHQPQVRRLAGHLRELGLPVTEGDDVSTAEWRKALWNLAINGLATICDAPNGDILDHAELTDFARDLVDEAARIAALDGIVLGDEDKAEVFRSLERTRSNVNATLLDLRGGRPTELEHLNAAVVRMAAFRGHPAPLHEAITRLMTYLERTGKRRPS